MSNTSGVEGHGARLDSWKAIAVYLDRHVRTVRRWEAEGLPVHRLRHKSRDSVYGYTAEIDGWLADRSRRDREWRHPFLLRIWRYGAVAIAAATIWFTAAQPDSPRTYAIAVLPFQNLSGHPTNAGICDTFTEELTTRLGRAEPGRLRVLARSATARHGSAPNRTRDARHNLNVDYVVEGAFLRVDSRVRITARLIRGRDESQVWGESYDYSAADVLDFQERISEAIVQQIRVVLLGARSPMS